MTCFTTHKSLGPAARADRDDDPSIGRQVDCAVFPGEQGGPHINAIAGMAVAFRLANPPVSPAPAAVVANALRLAEASGPRPTHPLRRHRHASAAGGLQERPRRRGQPRQEERHAADG